MPGPLPPTDRMLANGVGAIALFDQVDGVEEAHAFALVDGGDTQCCGDVDFAGAGATDQDQIARGRHEAGGCQLLDLRLRQRCFGPVDACEVAMRREARGFQLVAQAAHRAIGKLGLDQPAQPGFGLHRPAPRSRFGNSLLCAQES